MHILWFIKYFPESRTSAKFYAPGKKSILNIPESIITAGVGKVHDQLEWCMAKRFQRQNDVVNQQVSVRLPDSKKGKIIDG